MLSFLSVGFPGATRLQFSTLESAKHSWCQVLLAKLLVAIPYYVQFGHHSVGAVGHMVDIPTIWSFDLHKISFWFQGQVWGKI
jgi:hypothetical protein